MTLLLWATPLTVAAQAAAAQVVRAVQVEGLTGIVLAVRAPQDHHDRGTTAVAQMPVRVAVAAAQANTDAVGDGGDGASHIGITETAVLYGGGGGGSWGVVGVGGTGGGGNGGDGTDGRGGVPNTGGGGGGGEISPSTNGAQGGAGIVLIRYDTGLT